MFLSVDPSCQSNYGVLIILGFGYFSKFIAMHNCSLGGNEDRRKKVTSLLIKQFEFFFLLFCIVQTSDKLDEELGETLILEVLANGGKVCVTISYSLMIYDSLCLAFK